MNKFDEKIPEEVIDVTGAILTPGKPEKCQGNGEQKVLIAVVTSVIGSYFVFRNMTAYNNQFETCFQYNSTLGIFKRSV